MKGAAERAGKEDFACRYIRQENGGAPAARNHGLIESRGEYIQFLDSDDMLAPDKVERQVACFQSVPPRTVVYGGRRMFVQTENGIEVYDRSIKEPCEDAIGSSIVRNFLATEEGLWRRSDVVYNGPWDETLPVRQDYEYALRFVLLGGNFAPCPGAWCYFSRGGGASDHVGTRRTREAAESSIRVARRVEAFLAKQGRLGNYSEALGQRWLWLARRYASDQRDLAQLCYGNFRRLSPAGTAAGGLVGDLLCRALGFVSYMRVVRACGRLRAIVRRPTAPRPPMAVVATMREVYMMDYCVEERSSRGS